MLIELEKVGIDRDEKIIKITTKNPVYCLNTERIKKVVERIVYTGFRRLPVVDRRMNLVGIITYTDILDAFLRGEDLNNEIENIMVREVIYCNSSDTIGFVVQKMKVSRRGGLPVLERGKLVGIVTERDIINQFKLVNFGIKVKDVMTVKPFYLQPNLSIFDVLKTFVNTRYRRFPVVEENKVVGIVTGMDVLKYVFENKFKAEALDEDMNVIIKKDVYTINKDEDLSIAIKEMREKGVGGLIVIDDGELKGVITERNIMERVI